MTTDNRNSIFYASLLSKTIIKITGNDAANFLQSQLTNDITLITANHTQISAYCNPKGRMLAILHLVKIKDGYLAITETSIAEKLIARLKMYVLRSKVMIENISNKLTIIGLWGNNTENILTQSNISVPYEINAVSQFDKNYLIKLIDSNVLRYLIIINNNTNKIQFNKIANKSNENAWNFHAIQAMQPIITTKTQELFTPQMLNLDLSEVINFKKGCYPGQEIVARTHYLGNPKKRLFQGIIASNEIPTPGSLIFTKDSEQAAGEVVLAGQENQQINVLASIRLGASNDQLHLNNNSNDTLALI